MGEVYRARDTRLGRDVAIKVLPLELTSDPERLARFEREARLLASLNHPNISAIYGMEQFDDRQCLILELVEGEDLSERIDRGAPPVLSFLSAVYQAPPHALPILIMGRSRRKNDRQDSRPLQDRRIAR